MHAPARGVPMTTADPRTAELHSDVERSAADLAEAVFTRAEAGAREIAVSEAQADLIDTALRGLRADAGAPFAGSLHFPVYVYASLTGACEPAYDLAAALVLLNLGIHILDDLGDGDLPAHWRSRRPGEIMLIGTALVGVIPQLIVSKLDAPAETVVRMQQALGEGLAKIAAGQQTDLLLCDSETATADEVEASVAEKSGGRRVLYARLAGLLAGAAASEVAAYEEIGRAMGIVAQIHSDCADLFGPGTDSSDLLNGTRTLPIALRMDQTHGKERAQLLSRLRAARSDHDVRTLLRNELREAGIPFAAMFRAEVHRQRASRLLSAADAQEPGRSGLRAMLGALGGLSRDGAPA